MGKNDDADDVGRPQPSDPAVSIRLATFDQHRALLFSIAYRMLGSVADAEDMLQETYIRWQQTSDDKIRSPRAFLVTIVRLVGCVLINCSLHAYSAKST